jgi:hypothetical protein
MKSNPRTGEVPKLQPPRDDWELVNQKMEQFFQLLQIVPVENWVVQEKMSRLFSKESEDVEEIEDLAGLEKSQPKEEQEREEKQKEEKQKEVKRVSDLGEQLAIKPLDLASSSLLDQILIFYGLTQHACAVGLGDIDVNKIAADEHLPFLEALMKTYKEKDPDGFKKAYTVICELQSQFTGKENLPLTFFRGAMEMVLQPPKQAIQREEKDQLDSITDTLQSTNDLYLRMPPEKSIKLDADYMGKMHLINKYMDLNNIISKIQKQSEAFKSKDQPDSGNIMEKLAHDLREKTDDLFREWPITVQRAKKFEKDVNQLMKTAEHRIEKNVIEKQNKAWLNSRKELSSIEKLAHDITHILKKHFGILGRQVRQRYTFFHATNEFSAQVKNHVTPPSHRIFRRGG